MIKQSGEMGQLRRDNEFLAKTIKQMKLEAERAKNLSMEIDLKNVSLSAVGNEKADIVSQSGK